jgi:hypothetical protein
MPWYKNYYLINYLPFLTRRTCRRARLFDSERFEHQFVGIPEATFHQRERHVSCVLTMGRLDSSRFLSMITTATTKTTAAAIISNHPECCPRCRRATTKRRP